MQSHPSWLREPFGSPASVTVTPADLNTAAVLGGLSLLLSV